MTNKKIEQTITIAHATTPESLHEILAAALNFPGYYGKNWDAFWDCISDPDQSTVPDVLVLRGWDILKSRLPEDADALKKCLADLVKKKKNFSTEWASVR